MSSHWRVCLLFAIVASVAPAKRVLAAQWPTRQERDAAAEALRVGESAPDWLVQSETYAFGSDPHLWEALAASKVAFVTHCPVNREYFNRMHALGIRAFPYVTFYQGFATRTYEGVNLKDHPEFIEVDAEGNLKRTGFWESEDAKNMYTTCPAVAEYQEAMLAWVRQIMELGADGVFVDNLGRRVPCFGPKFGRHQHLYDDPNHAFAMLLKRVREVVKHYRPDGAVLGNSANPLSLPHEYWAYLDAEMLESYICTWVSKDRWFDWHDHWHEQGLKLQPFIKAGKQIQALSYLGHTGYGVREDAFFCYASARLAGFVWNGGRPLSDPDTAVLYQIRLGPPLGPEQSSEGVYYRLFDRGMVVLNPDKQKAASLTLPADVPSMRLYDLFAGAVVDAGANGSRLDIPAYAGRVYLYAAGSADELSGKPGPTLTVVTQPALGAVRFRVDGFDYWTHSGRWTTEYTLGPQFGRFQIAFDAPGKHTVEIVDIVPADMKTPAGYGTGERLGQFMDPSQPTRPSGGRKFHFREWAGAAAGREPRIEVELNESRTLRARFDVQEPASQPAESAAAGRTKKLIEFGWDEPDPAFMREHIAELERSPFDGCVFHINYRRPGGKTGRFTWEAWGKQAFTEADVQDALDDLKSTPFKRFKHNFLRFNTTPADLDWFDDHTAVINNARLAARIAREAGCAGLLFDIEQYNAPLFNYAEQRDAKTRSWSEYADQVRRRGREVMTAFQEGYPDLVVFLTFGYSLPWEQSGGDKDALAKCGYGLLAPFMDGLVDAAAGKTRIVDGCELAYGYREAKQFSDARRRITEGLLPMVAEPEKYRPRVSVSFGLWMDYDWRHKGWNVKDPGKNVLPPETFEALVRAALASADEYVWIYTETPRWWSAEGKPVKLPAAYDAALRRMR
jgi:hypothetical protein